jgi:hypothetical protein
VSGIQSLEVFLSGIQSLEVFVFRIYLYVCWRSKYQDGPGWETINWFNPPLALRLSQAKTFFFTIYHGSINALWYHLVDISENSNFINCLMHTL